MQEKNSKTPLNYRELIILQSFYSQEVGTAVITTAAALRILEDLAQALVATSLDEVIGAVNDSIKTFTDTITDLDND